VLARRAMRFAVKVVFWGGQAAGSSLTV
jgi:hypothetical protein